MSQQTIAFVIVGVAALGLLISFFRAVLAAPLANFFLKRGNVKLAVKIKSQAKQPGCESCPSSNQSEL
jgi:hypothetical protein